MFIMRLYKVKRLERPFQTHFRCTIFLLLLFYPQPPPPALLLPTGIEMTHKEFS